MPIAECSGPDNSCGNGFYATGYDGSKIWKKIHSIPKTDIECEECAHHGDFEFKGLHDHINVGLQKEPFDPVLYEKWAKEVISVYENWKHGGHALA